MTIHLVARLRQPTFLKPPDGLQKVTVIEESANCFVVQVTLLEGEKTTLELSKIIWYALWDLFGSASFSTTSEFNVQFDLISTHQLQQLCKELSIQSNSANPNRFTISRAWWYQRYQIFAYPARNQASLFSERLGPESENGNGQLIHSDKKLQNEMPPPPDTIYEKYIAHLDSYFCLSIFGDSPNDLDLLHGWLNDPRVDEYWKDAGDGEFHVKWLQERYEDSHVLPVLGSYRGTNGADKDAIEPFAYYEIYWAAEDKIAEAYSPKPFDRGIHMLVGSSRHRGPHRVRSWLPSLIHFIYSDDPRTQRIVSEPDHRNIKMISYLQQFGFKKIKQFDMGHKTAAIMMLEKDDFWENCPL